MDRYKMKSFWSLNKAVIPFLLKATSLIFSGFALVIFLVVNYNLDEWGFDLPLFIAGALSVSIGCPLFLLIVGYLDWFWNKWNRQRAYSQKPFTELHKLGFSRCITGGYWTFFEELQYAEINGFHVYGDTDGENKKFIRFTFTTLYPSLTRKELKLLKKHFKTLGIVFDRNALYVQYKIRKPSIKDIYELEKDLLKVTDILVKHGFVPSDEGLIADVE